MRRGVECIWLRIGKQARDAETVGYCKNDAGPIGNRTYPYSHTGYLVASERSCILVNIT